MIVLAGVTVIDWSTALVTVTPREPTTPPVVAKALKVPVVWPVARPVELTTPTAGVCVDQITVEVRSCVVPSEYVPSAFN
jgi:hypothetical protein